MTTAPPGPESARFRSLAGLEALHRFQESLDVARTKEALAAELLKHVRSFPDVTAAGLYLVDDESLEFSPYEVMPRSSTTFLNGEFQHVVEDRVLGWAVQGAAPAVLTPRTVHASERGVLSLILVPLTTGPQTLGLFLVALDVAATDVSQSAVELLAVAGKQFALTLRNYALYDTLWKEKINLQVAHDELQDRVRELEETREELQLSVIQSSEKSSELEALRRDLEHQVEARTAELQVANQELERLSAVDALTGVYNRRHLDDAMQREAERASRYGVHTAVVICDLNGLKHINDRAGHLMGDLALKETAQILLKTARKTDIVARFGGDEFVIVTPHTTGVAKFIERVHAAVSHRNRLHAAETFELSIAIGYACASPETDLFAALRQADDMMYADKRKYYEAKGELARTG